MAAKTPPWKKKRPNKPATKLSPALTKRAADRARAAGRTYPNLVDNMWAAREAKKAR